jgi:hypothetical protein
MKWYLFIWILPTLSFSQKTAFFETKILLEDAMGNKDSVVVGHDEFSEYEYNPQFGEIDINDPWDSVFEVRAAHYSEYESWIDPALVLSKKIIGHSEGKFHPNHNCLYVNEDIILFFNAKYLPIKVSWNPVDFQNFCNTRSFITTHLVQKAAPEIFNDTLFGVSCLAEDSVFYSSDFDQGEFGFFLFDEIEGQGIDTLKAFLLNFWFEGFPYSPCKKDIVNINDLLSELDIAIYPNPTFGNINIVTDINFTWQLYNNDGKLYCKGESKEIDLSEFANGLYFLKIMTKDKIISKKIVKIE